MAPRINRWNWKQALVGTAKRRAEPFQTLDEMEADHIGKVLEAYDHNLLHAAKALGISRSTLYRRMARVTPVATKAAAKSASKSKKR